MKHLTTLALTLSLVGLTAAIPVTASATTTGTTTAPAAASTQKAPAHLLFIVRSHSAVITEADGVYKLTLTGLDPQVLYFSDRPQRIAGQISTTSAISKWSKGPDSFKADHPNAVFLHSPLSSNHTGFAKGDTVTLSHPVANADGSWTFNIKSIAGQSRVGQYDNAVLFVDSADYCYSPCYMGG